VSTATIKAGSYCPVCRGFALSDCTHEVQRFRELRTHSSAYERSLEAKDEEIAEARAALSWLGEVYPSTNAESDGAIVHITWDQWNRLRKFVGLPPQKALGKKCLTVPVSRVKTEGSGA
jgi:hypothetical protein